MLKLMIGACVALLALTFNVGAQDAEWTKVVEAAKREGRVTLYSSRVGSPYHREVAKAFEKKYGIKVDILESRGHEQAERIRTEQVSGKVRGDLVELGTTGILMDRAGYFQHHGLIPNLKNLVPPFAATDTLVPSWVQAYGILINTNLVPPSEEPKGWTDLTDPKWKGKILADDPRATGASGFVLNYVLLELFGRSFLEKLAAQNLVFSLDIGNDMRRVARGEYAVYMPLLLPEYPALKGLPVKAIAPVEGSPSPTYFLTVLKNAPRPNAARLLMNFFYEPESQLIYARGGNTTVIKGVQEMLAKEGSLQTPKPFKLLGTYDVDRLQEVFKIVQEVYKK